MIGILKNNIYKVPEVIGIELRFQQDGNYTFTLVHLKKEKDLIDVLRFVPDCESLEQCLTYIPGGTPVVMVFTGKGIISKKVSSTDAGLDATVATLVPNANIDDFAFDTFVSGNYTYVSLVRKSKIEPIIQQFLEKKVSVVGAGLEFIPMLRFQSSLGLELHEVSVLGYKLQFSSAVIIDFAVSAEPAADLKLGSSTIPSQQLLPYTAAFSTILDPHVIQYANIKSVKEQHSEFLEKKLFRFGLIGTLVAILFILVVNTLVFTGQYSKNENLKQQSYQFKGKSEDLKKEELTVFERENFLNQNGWLHKSTLSFMCDKLAATVPGSITLQDLSVNPLLVEHGTAHKKTSFVDRKLSIKGKCYKSSDLSNWIQILKNLNWISDVQMIDYLHDHSHNSAVFNLEITYHIE